jgi:hypothetical protein
MIAIQNQLSHIARPHTKVRGGLGGAVGSAFVGIAAGIGIGLTLFNTLSGSKKPIDLTPKTSQQTHQAWLGQALDKLG